MKKQLLLLSLLLLAGCGPDGETKDVGDMGAQKMKDTRQAKIDKELDDGEDAAQRK